MRMVGEITDVDFARNFQKSIENIEGHVQYANDRVKNQILNAEPSDILKVVLTIKSPITILAVEKLDANWFLTQIS